MLPTTTECSYFPGETMEHYLPLSPTLTTQENLCYKYLIYTLVKTWLKLS